MVEKIELKCEDFFGLRSKYKVYCCDGCHEDFDMDGTELIELESDKISGNICCSIMRVIHEEPNIVELAYLKKVF